MNNQTTIVEYKCPSCGAGLSFSGDSQKLDCEYCGTTFELDAVRAFNENTSKGNSEDIQLQDNSAQTWSEYEQQTMNVFVCPSCGGEVVTEETTVATFCPYCDNPTIMPGRLTGSLKPDAVIPFSTTKEDAKKAFLNLCKGKILLPKMFTQEQRLEKITGMYVPFWLYDCSGSFDGSYKATRLHTWSDAKYNYTKTDHFLLRRGASADFVGIPMDGSSKMDDTFMESIEPFDYNGLKAFDKVYLTGFLADKYDVDAEKGHERIKERVERTINDQLQDTFIGYASVIPTSRQLQIKQQNARYVLLPVWILNTKYKNKIYTFAMNGQTGKITGSFPICRKKSAMWFWGIFAGVTALASLVQIILA